MSHRKLANLSRIAAALVIASSLGAVPRAEAGCGCTKPPPPIASVRPAVVYPGAEVALFDDSLVEGEIYRVRFTSSADGESAEIFAPALLRRDQADGEYKMQLAVPLPRLSLGPASIDVTPYDDSQPLLSLGDEAFTVAPMPIAVPKGLGTYTFENYRAAVSRDGVVYVSLDFGSVQDARVFEAQGYGYPLRFTEDDLAFYNRQGFLMQLLDGKIPGLSSIAAPAQSQDSDLLRYSRHEFNTYFLQHDERKQHALDPSDPNWHLDGTPHIDHNHQVLEMMGVMDDGSLPEPGATPPFTFEVSTYTFFHHGLFGDAEVEIKEGSIVDSYDSETGMPGAHGNLLSNGEVRVLSNSLVDGDVTAYEFDIDGSAVVTGSLIQATEDEQFLQVDVPSELEDLGSVQVGPEGLVIGEGSYYASELRVEGGTLLVDNASGPVTIYVEGDVIVRGLGRVVASDRDPEKFALYVAGDHQVVLRDEGSFYGVVYAPEARIEIGDSGRFFGAFVGGEVRVEDGSRVHYDESLSHDPCVAPIPDLAAVWPLEVDPGDWINIDTGDMALEDKLRIAGLETQGVVFAKGMMAQIPPELLEKHNIEISLASADGCRSKRTVFLNKVEAVEVEEPAGSGECGLLGIEFLLVFPLARVFGRGRRG